MKFLLPTILLGAFLCCLSGCEGPRRVHLLTDFEYTSRPDGAPVELYERELERNYYPIAVIDSDRYLLRDYAPDAKEGIPLAKHQAARAEQEAAMAHMREDLERLARQLGADAVHKIRMLSDKTRGFMPDERVPIPGAIKQGYQDRYFLRGEAVKYLETPQFEKKGESHLYAR